MSVFTCADCKFSADIRADGTFHCTVLEGSRCDEYELINPDYPITEKGACFDEHMFPEVTPAGREWIHRAIKAAGGQQ